MTLVLEVKKLKRNEFRKTKTEKKRLKTIKANLSIPFQNITIIHMNADSDKPTIVVNKAQLTSKKRKLHKAQNIRYGFQEQCRF